MDVGGFLSEITGGLLEFLPNFAKALLECFMALFFTYETAEGGANTVTGLNILGTVAIAFFIIGLAWRTLPTVLGWMKMGMSKAKRSRSAKSSKKNP